MFGCMCSRNSSMTLKDDRDSRAGSRPSPSRTRFEAEAAKAVDELRLASRAILAGLSGGPSTAAELASYFGLSRKLGWQVWTMAAASSAAEAVGVIPGRGALAQFLRAAREHAVSGALILQLEDAIRGLEALAEVHAGDRSSLDTLLQAIAGAKGDVVPEATLRTAYRANSDIFGIQVETCFLTTILWPGADPSRADVASLHGRVGLRRLRPNAPCVWTEFVCRGQTEEDSSVAHSSPLVQDAEAQGALTPMIPEFCSKPIPFMRVQAPRGGASLRAVELIEGPIGDTGTTTCITGEIIRNGTSRYAKPDGPPIYISAHLDTPTRLFIGDLLVHRDLATSIELDAGALRASMEDRAEPRRIRGPERLSVTCAFERIGAGLASVKLREVSRYTELIDWTCRELSWDARQLEVYRLRVSYPVTPGTIMHSVTLHPPDPS